MSETIYNKENKRVSKFFEGSNLKDQVVTLIGVGGGGEIALHLLRSGISKINLIDFDNLEEGNLVRHVCGSKYIGQNKAKAVRKLLLEYLGEKNNDIIAYNFDVFDDYKKLEKIIKNSNVVIVATDKDSSRYYINEICVENKIPTVFVGTYEDGCGGEVFVSVPGMACYECLSCLQGRVDFLKEYAKSVSKKDCSSLRDANSLPGLGIDQSFLNSIAARKCLDILVKKSGNITLPPVARNWILWSLFGIKEAFKDHLSSISEDISIQTNCKCRHF